MDKTDQKAARLGRIQNAVILLLTLSAAFLFTKTPLFGDLADQSPRQIVQSLFSHQTSSGGGAELSAFAAPVRVVFTNDYARYGLDAITMLDDSFEQVGSFLSEAVGSAFAMSSGGEEAFVAAMNRSGIYFDFTAGIPLEILSDALGVEAPEAREISVRRAALYPAGAESALCLLDTQGKSYTFSTAVSGTALSAYLESFSGSGADFARSLGEEYAMLSPYTLVLSEPAARDTLAATLTLGDVEVSDLLRLAEFNPHTENAYTDASGTTVVRESYGTLRLGADSTVSYQGGSAEAGSLYHVAAEGGKPTVTEAAAAAQKLASTLLQNTGAASLYLSGAEQTENGYLITLDFVVDGTPLCFSDGAHAASVTVEKQSITAFTLHYRGYTLTDTPALLLPLTQAAAIARRYYEGCELSVRYVDSGGEEVALSWIPG